MHGQSLSHCQREQGHNDSQTLEYELWQLVLLIAPGVEHNRRHGDNAARE